MRVIYRLKLDAETADACAGFCIDRDIAVQLHDGDDGAILADCYVPEGYSGKFATLWSPFVIGLGQTV